MAETEQNKTEEPTPFKLKRARQQGQVARGADLGYFAAIVGLILFLLVAGEETARVLANTMRALLLTSISNVTRPEQAQDLLATAFAPSIKMLILMSATIVLVVGFAELVQLRGFVLSTKPLKPDFGRLNPAKGFKRVFSMRMLKETIKNVVKMAVYSASAWLMARYLFETYLVSLPDAASLAGAMQDGGMRLLYLFAFIAMLIAVIDQIIVRREFLKQMRMSRNELTREIKEREGDPRIKRKRRQLHAEFAKQTKAMGKLAGSDMLIVNPQHFAVGLVYDPQTMSAPRVTAKGRNRFALMLKRRAAEMSITIFEAPPLARALYRHCEPDQEVPASEYAAVVNLYLKLARTGWRGQEHFNA